MKLVEKVVNKEFISIDEITFNHIIVGTSKYNNPLILSKGYYEENANLCFMMINGDNSIITKGNGYAFSNDDDSPCKMVRKAIYNGCKVEVFDRRDWKQALQWLIDNCK